VGYLSDRSRFSWGQRKPFIAIGAVNTVVSILMLGWTEKTIYWLVDLLDLEVQQDDLSKVEISFAIFWIFVLNISIQPLQVGLRALAIENCPAHQQAQASAWASRMTGLGNIIGYLVGFAPLPDGIKSMCTTQFQGLCVLASLALATTIPITCVFVREQDPEATFLNSIPRSGAVAMTRRLLRTFKTMPVKIRHVCQIQFFAWMGWFPFLFYATT
jgi:solute carrier family 45 protein 1/2/4